MRTYFWLRKVEFQLEAFQALCLCLFSLYLSTPEVQSYCFFSLLALKGEVYVKYKMLMFWAIKSLVNCGEGALDWKDCIYIVSVFRALKCLYWDTKTA